MKLGRILTILLLMLAFSVSADAQGFIKNLGKKAVEKVKQKIENKVERETDEAMDDVLDGKKSDKKSKGNRDVDYENEELAAEGPVDFTQIQAKSDFKRGGTVFFNDDFAGEQMGEFPSKWDLLGGSEVEVVSIKGRKAVKIEESKIKPLMKEIKYLPEEFTIEDVVRCFNLGSAASARKKVTRLCRDHLIEKISEEKGGQKALFQKTGNIML